MLQGRKSGSDSEEEAPQDVASWVLRTDDGESWRNDDEALMEDSRTLIVAGR